MVLPFLGLSGSSVHWWPLVGVGVLAEIRTQKSPFLSAATIFPSLFLCSPSLSPLPWPPFLDVAQRLINTTSVVEIPSITAIALAWPLLNTAGEGQAAAAAGFPKNPLSDFS